jgi:hypothetical protein
MKLEQGMIGPRAPLAQAVRIGISFLGFGSCAALADDPAAPKPSLEELEQRIEILERKLEAQQAVAQVAAPAASAAATTVSAPQIIAGPGGKTVIQDAFVAERSRTESRFGAADLGRRGLAHRQSHLSARILRRRRRRQQHGCQHDSRRGQQRQEASGR